MGLNTGERAEPRPYYGALDGVRGIAAVLIVMYHLGPLFGHRALESYLAVDVFFVLSGAVIARSYEDRLKGSLSVRDFAVIRVVRLYPLYAAGTGIGAAALYFSHTMGAKQFSESLLFAALLCPFPRVTPYPFPLNPPAWSLFCELVFNHAYAYSLRYLTNRVLHILAAVSGLALVFLVATSADGLNFGVETATLPQGLVRSVYSFSLGVIIHRQLVASAQSPPWGRHGSAVAWFVVAAVGLILFCAPTLPVKPFYDLTSVLVVFPLVVWVAIRANVSGVTAKIFRFLGAASYAVYAIHVPIKAALEQAVPAAVGRGLTGDGAEAGTSYLARFAPWSGIAFVLVVLFLAYVLDEHFDRPVRAFLKQRLISSRQSTAGPGEA